MLALWWSKKHAAWSVFRYDPDAPPSTTDPTLDAAALITYHRDVVIKNGRTRWQHTHPKPPLPISADEAPNAWIEANDSDLDLSPPL